MKINKVGLVVDSTFKLNQDFVKEKDFKVVSLDIIIGDKIYLDGEVTNDQIYDYMDKNIKVTTSQPAPSRFLEAYQALLDAGYTHIFCLTVSESLSGTFNSANLAKGMLEDESKVTVIDTKSAICGSEYLAEKMINYIETLDSIDEIESAFLKERNKGSLIFTVDDLNILVRSGRLSKIQGMIGNLLKIKPILRFDQGTLSVEHKVRSNDNVIKYLINEILKLEEKAKTIVRISYTTTSTLADKLAQELKERLNNVQIKVVDRISAVIAVHVGKAGLGIYLANE